MTVDQSLASSTSDKPKRGGFITADRVTAVLIFLGILVSGYLSYVKLTDVPMTCIADGPFSCDVVQNSAYSKLAGIPIAWLGFGVYLLLAALYTFKNRINFLRENGRLVIFGLTLFAWIYSMWLVYIQFFVLQALCQWCLMHEAIITVIFGLVSFQLYRYLTADA